MILLPTYGHMPFKVGARLYCCVSEAPATLVIPPLASGLALGVPPQEIAFQPWVLAFLEDGVVTPIVIGGLTASAPTRVFCNPVVDGDTLSFVHGGTLYTAPLGGGVLTPTVARTHIFTGFAARGQLVFARPSCAVGGSVLVVDDDEVPLPFDHLLRVVPHGETDLIVTGLIDGSIVSLLWHAPDDIERITVAGEDVYKCCLDGDHVVHAKRGVGFEDRILHRELLTLLPYA